jgi:hypothetical protein
MIARCARCQGTFTTDRYGVQSCPHCGSEVHLADPNVGSAPPAEPPSVPPPGVGAPQLPPVQKVSAPFARRKELGFFPAYIESWKGASLQPNAFFRAIRTDEVSSAVLFGFLGLAAGSLVQAILGQFMNAASAPMMDVMFKRMPNGAEMAEKFHALYQPSSGAFLIGQLILIPIMSLIGIYLGAGITHLFLMLFRGAKKGFNATLTACAYSSGIFLLNAVPACGGIVALVWFTVVFIIALSETHEIGVGRSALAVLAPYVLFCLCCCGAVGLGVGAMMKVKTGGA